MPRPNAGDVVIVHSAKVQDRNGISLLTNRNTVIHIYSGVQIPEPPGSARQALQPPRDSGRWMPDARVNDYIPWLYHSTSKYDIPDQDEFRVRTERSLNVNVREKFSTLDKVREGRYYDAIVQVVKDPFDEGMQMNLWVTDYTENDSFFLFSWDGANKSDTRDYDANMYTTMSNQSSNNWPGPFGKRSMQVSCWEPHATFVRENDIKAGTWVQLRNLHVRFGRNSANLEGSLHEDKLARSGRIQVEILQLTDSKNIDDRLKQALKRKRDYEKNKKTQQKSYERDSDASAKRKASEDAEPAKMNAKARRALQRTALEKRYEEQAKKREEQLNLNKYSKFTTTYTTPLTHAGTNHKQPIINSPMRERKPVRHAHIDDDRARAVDDESRGRGGDAEPAVHLRQVPRQRARGRLPAAAARGLRHLAQEDRVRRAVGLQRRRRRRRRRIGLGGSGGVRRR